MPRNALSRRETHARERREQAEPGREERPSGRGSSVVTGLAARSPRSRFHQIDAALGRLAMEMNTR